MKILIIEDDKSIAKFLQKGLKEEGYVTHWVNNGEEGYIVASQESWDLLILDLMLPKLDGLSVCKKLRQTGVQFPILMLTAKDSLNDRISGLDSGADDYLAKPFSFNELLARTRALFRRSSNQLDSQLQSGELKLNLVSHKATYMGKEIDLTSREFSLLEFFLRRKGHALTRTVIAESVWGYDFQSGTNVIDVYVNYLRNKLKKLMNKDVIHTLRHRGYIFEDSDA